MKNKKKLLCTLSILLIFSTLLSGCDNSKPSAGLDSELPETESEIISEEVTEEVDTEIGTEEIESTEESTEEILTPVVKEPSYNEQIGLDFVDPPAKRNREQAIEKIKELSRWYPALYFVYKNADLYSTEMLLSGAGNPEMADFMYGYLTHDERVTGGITENERPEDYPLFLQFDVRWGYMIYGTQGNMGCSGCGPTCLSMAAYYLTGNPEYTPDAVARYSLDHGYYVESVGTSWTLLTSFPRSIGLTSYKMTYTEENMKYRLDLGEIIICSVRPGDFTSSGHFIVVYGYDENGFKINDPKSVYRSGLSWTYAQIQDDIKGAWCIGNPNK